MATLLQQLRSRNLTFGVFLFGWAWALATIASPREALAQSSLIVKICVQTIPPQNPPLFNFTGANTWSPPSGNDFAAVYGSNTFSLQDTIPPKCLSFDTTLHDPFNKFTETVPAGWTLTGITCTGVVKSAVGFMSSSGIRHSTFQPGDNTVGIDQVDPNVTCTFVNNPSPRYYTAVNVSGGTQTATNDAEPPLTEPAAETYVELPVINQIAHPPLQGQGFQPCSGEDPRMGVVWGVGGGGLPTGTAPPDGGVEVQPETEQVVIFDPAVSMPTVDTTTDAWLASCNDSVENENADETVPDDLKNQVNQNPEPVIDPSDIPPPPPSRLCGVAPVGPVLNFSTQRRSSSSNFNIITCRGGPPAPALALGWQGERAAKDLLDCSLPFCGRDVILVHGYRLGPLGDWYTDSPNGALSTWPDNPREFKPGGYWFIGAVDYWEDYIVHKLAAGYVKSTNSTRMPRVLTIAYPVSQRLPVAADAMLSQINDAINCTLCADTNVYTVARGGPFVPVQLNSKNDTRGVPFCTLGCVIVSHSTGGPVTNLAMYYAHTSGGSGSPQPCNASIYASSNWVRISDCYIKAHVAIEPAFSGSNHATELYAAALTLANSMTDPVTFPVTCSAFLGALKKFTDTDGITFKSAPGTCVKAALLTPQTSTTDLLPVVMTGVWQPLLAQSPVPTLIVATSHPTTKWPLMWGPLFPGFPDNTLTMDSQLGRPPIDLVHFPYVMRPYVWVAARRFLLDRANDGRWPLLLSSRKAFGYYVEQTNLFRIPPLFPFFVSAAANPYLTPTGMHIPLIGNGNIPANSVGNTMGPNTHTFLQAAASHFWRYRFGEFTASDWDWTDPASCSYAGSPAERGYNYQPISGTNTQPSRSMNEESRALFDPILYDHSTQNPNTWLGTGGLAADGIPLVSPAMKTAVEGHTVIRRWRKWKIPFTRITVGGGIRWQRTYYRLKNWQCKDYLDYINDFAVRL